jgi:hypothetical protein
VRTVVAVSPWAAVPEAVEAEKTMSPALLFTTALEGATDSAPKPKAVTTTSAKRLNVVFLDICFLSIVVTETFPVAALR